MGALPDKYLNILDAALVLNPTNGQNTTLDVYRRHINTLKKDIKLYLYGLEKNMSVNLYQDALTQIIHKRYGYVGGYSLAERAEEAYLTNLINYRAGADLTLSILYLGLALELGWTASALSFPFQLLIRLEHNGERIIIDPSSNGATVSAQNMRSTLKMYRGNHEELHNHHYQTIGTRAVLFRLYVHIKELLLNEKKVNEAIKIIKTLRLIAPGFVDLLRELGILYAQQDKIVDAIRVLEDYLKQGPPLTMRFSTSSLVRQLKQRL